MVTKTDIEKFYKDVEALGLKFPVAAIAEATETSKPQVSRILNKKIDPSPAFLKRFYEKFPNSVKNVSRENNGNLADKQKIIDLLEKQVSNLEGEIPSLDDLRRDLVVVAKMQTAIIDILLVLASESGKKGAYSKSAAVLRKHQLLHSLRDEDS